MHRMVHPAVVYLWKSRLEQQCCESRAHVGGAGSWAGRPGREAAWHAIDPEGTLHGGSFGVKRPLRFLAYKLGLDESQVTQLAQILDELKTERAQAAVDDRRTLSAFADAVQGESFDAARAGEGSSLRRQSGERVGDAVVKALGRIHALLNSEQRGRLAYLIRTGTLLL
jgi:Spy/CpxP family protein refolding chaperone